MNGIDIIAILGILACLLKSYLDFIIGPKTQSTKFHDKETEVEFMDIR